MTEVSASGWQSGIRSAVRLARHDAGEPRDRQHVALLRCRRPGSRQRLRLHDDRGAPAMATRSVSALAETSTMRASPFGVEMRELAHRLVGPAFRQPRARMSPRARHPAAASATRRPGSSAPPARRRRSRSAGVVDAALADAAASPRHQRRQLLGRCEVDLQGLEIAVVDADQPRVAAAARARARRGHAPRPARRGRGRAAVAASSRACVIVERRHDQQDAVGARARGSRPPGRDRG